MASRMETNGLPSMIHVSPDTAFSAQALGYVLMERGMVEIKVRRVTRTLREKRTRRSDDVERSNEFNKCRGSQEILACQ